MTGFVDDLDVFGRIGSADRVQLVGPRRRIEDREGRALRHTVDFDETARPACENLFLMRGGQVRPRAPFARGRRRVDGARRIVEHPRDLHGNDEDVVRLERAADLGSRGG